MRQPSLIADYLDAVAHELSFDTALSLRVRAEIEDHLWEATDGGRSLEDQSQAIENFGDPHELAQQYIAASLLRRVRRLGVAMILASTAIFLAMKMRVVWYAFMQLELNAHWAVARAIGLEIDRCGSILAIAFTLIGWAYIGTRRAPIRFHLTYNRQLNRCIVLCCGAAGALTLSVVIETILTGMRLFGTEWSAASLVPILSLAVEMAATTLLVLHIRGMVRRTAVVSALIEL